MSADQSFGMLAKNRRRELGLTQDELARRVGCAPITIRKIEADDLRPSVQIAERMAMALNVPLEERAGFVKLARTELAPIEEPKITPMPSAEEIGSEDLSGRAIRGYALGERLGNGGMGAVYRAVQPLVEREVAIKIILPKFANHPDFIRRFEAEAQLVARLEHPHVVPLYDYWREPNVAYLVMRLLRGGSVQSLLKNGTALPPETVLHLIEQIGSALGAAHRAGVVHRDLKPANVLLDEDNNAYLADFGIAKNLSNFSSETQADVVLGSPDYISPEQIKAEFVRPQTDIYALGVMLYELLTGAVPFRGPTPFEVMHQHLNAPLPPLAASRVGLPGAVDEVIKHATAKDPLARYETVDEMLDDLRNVLGSKSAADKAIAIHSRTTMAPLTELDNPYKGLRAFCEGDAQDFFGREGLLQQLLIRLGEGGELSRFLAVVGPSGSGKSSVVKAGLIPALRRGALPGSEQWFILEMMPGAHPLEELEAALLRVAVNPPTSLMEQFTSDNRGLIRAVRRSLPVDPNIELVLVIDQFEETFTLVQNENERVRFLGLLVAAALDEASRIRIIVTLRADFIDRPLAYMDFGEILRQRMEIVLPLTTDEMESAIASPAGRLGLTLEPGLVSTMLHDLADQPGALPLLQFALTELFEKREANTLTKSAYQQIGGVLGALGRRAEEVYNGLTPECQLIAKQLFLRLVTLGEGVEDTRRRALIAELESLNLGNTITSKEYTRSFTATLDAFGRARLLSFDRDPGTRGPTVEVAHEAILREWSRLREWLNESRADVRIERQLANAASEWQEADRDSSFLMTGSRLEQFEGWAANTSVALTQEERAFVDASIAERDRREMEERARQQRELEAAQKLAQTERAHAEEQTHSANRLRIRNRMITTVGSIAVLLALLAGTFGVQSNQNATVAQNNAATAQIAKDNALNAQATAQAERSIAQQQALINSVRELSSEANANLISDPERSILIALQALNKTYSLNGTVMPEAEEALHNAVQASRIELTLNGHTDQVWNAVFSPDGKLIASGSEDGTAKIWDAATGKELLTLKASTNRGVNGVDFSPDGKTLATADADSTARIWDVATGKELMTLNGHTDRVQCVDFSPDGTRLATASNDHTVRIWDVATGKQLLMLTEENDGEIYWVTFNSTGTRVATAIQKDNEGWASVWNIETGEKLFTVDQGTSRIAAAAFSPDDSILATASADQTAKLWDAHNGNRIKTFYGHSEALTNVKFSPDGTKLATASWDRSAIIWNVATGQEILTLNGHTRDVNTVAFNPAGNLLVTASSDKTIRVWNVAASHEYQTFVNGPKVDFIKGAELAYSPDGTKLVAANSDLEPKVWDLKTGDVLFTLKGHTDLVSYATFNQDGTLIGTASNDGTAKVWDATTGKELLTLVGHTNLVFGIDFSPDGKYIATSGFDQTAKLWDAKTGKNIRTLIYKDWIFSVAFSPDGKMLAAGSRSGVGIIWEVETGKQLFILPKHIDVINQILFSPDGNHVATASLDGTAKVWDARDGKELFTISPHSASVWDVSYSHDGKTLATVTANTIQLWDAETGKELLKINAPTNLTGIAFSPDDRQLAVAGRDGTTRIYLLRIEDLVTLAKTRATRALTQDECVQYLHLDTCPAP